jgi:hypothetical protein
MQIDAREPVFKLEIHNIHLYSKQLRDYLLTRM